MNDEQCERFERWMGLAKWVWTLLVALCVASFGMGVAVTEIGGRVSNLETYGSKGLQKHEEAQTSRDETRDMRLQRMERNLVRIGTKLGVPLEGD